MDETLAARSPNFAGLYSKTRRPSIAPEKLFRALLPQAFYTMRSEHQLMEQLDYFSSNSGGAITTRSAHMAAWDTDRRPRRQSSCQAARPAPLRSADHPACPRNRQCTNLRPGPVDGGRSGGYQRQCAAHPALPAEVGGALDRLIASFDECGVRTQLRTATDLAATKRAVMSLSSFSGPGPPVVGLRQGSRRRTGGEAPAGNRGNHGRLESLSE